LPPIVELGLSRADKARFSVDWIILDRDADEPAIELHQNLVVTVVKAEFQNWTRKWAFVVNGTAEIVRFVPKYVTRVDGISLSDCRNLVGKFGKDFPVLIDANPSILAKTRYSPEKRELIVAACRREIKARREHPSVAQDIVDKLWGYSETKVALKRLVELNVVRKIEKKITAPGGSVSAEIGERIVWSDHATIRPGIISTLAKFPSQSVEVKLDDGETLSLNPRYLRQETTQTDAQDGAV
jgi:hypothetical protein